MLATLNGDDILLFQVPVNDPNADDNTYRVYAQVWATPLNSGDFQPAAWVSTLTEVDESNPNQPFIQLQLDSKWLSADLGVPLQLGEVVIQDVNTYIIVSDVTSMNVEISQNNIRHLSKIQFDGVITEQMHKGKLPELFSMANNYELSSASGAIVLVHGCCSPSNPWQTYASDFTNPFFFLSPDSNDLNDVFAQKIATFAQSQGLSS